ncbi:antibiotic biosynthesis monooxygenase [Danxiaibacter flavus]|uniref:Antibiotic biosynthesis monooxygenase n=1 Tax=Danxiaibacter flavus TaxID=3049108 RepID=A0ABV3ZNB4_9BACT|nr:antibiotic biosynthesis monooxygenase [Chitinophagaceae bacterium DXS]
MNVAKVFVLHVKSEIMIVVIFEVEPAKVKWDEYINMAAELYDELTEVEGFISVERFKSIRDETKLLSLSFWKDEESVANWRNAIRHRAAQEKGRVSVFRNYRLRVANVIRDYGMEERDGVETLHCNVSASDTTLFHHK